MVRYSIWLLIRLLNAYTDETVKKQSALPLAGLIKNAHS